MSKHAISTVAWVVVAVFGAGFYAGTVFGVVTSPSAYDVRTIEKRLRTVFCEQAIRNEILHKCEVD